MPRLADRVAETTTTTGTGSLTLLGAPARRRTFSAIFGTDAFYYSVEHRSADEWEQGVGVISAGVLVRTPIQSSNGGAAVDFSVGVKDVRCAAPAALLMGGSVDKAFSAAISFRSRESMPQQTVSSVIAFTVDSTGALNGAEATVDLIADGVNVPTFTGFRRWGSSDDYINTAGVRNCIRFFWSSGIAWYYIGHEYGTPVESVPATAITYSGPATGVVGAASTNFTAAANGTLPVSVDVTPSDGGAGGTFTPSTVTLTPGATSATFTYTGASTGAKTLSFANNGGLTNSPASLSFTVNAAATAPGAPTSLGGTAASTSVALAWTAPSSNGGAAITDYVVQYKASSSGTWLTYGDGTSTTAAATVTGLTASTSYDFRVAAVNSVGTGSYSTTYTVNTTSAGAQPMRFTGLVGFTESGDGTTGWNYTGTATYTTMKSVSALKLASGTDGYVQLTIGYTPSGSAKQIWLGFGTSASAQIYSGMTEAINAGSTYSLIIGPSTFAAYGSPYTGLSVTSGDKIRLRRAGSTIYHEVSNDGGASWSTYRSAACPTGDLYFYLSGDGAGIASDVRQMGLA